MAGSPKVVIVGAGPAGIRAAKSLEEAADFKGTVTIIEPKGWHEINWATPRVLTDPDFVSEVIHPYSAVPGLGNFVAASATAITSSAVVLDSGASVPFDYLILAPGSTYPEPAIKGFLGSLANRKAAIKAEQQRLQAANSVLIIGGGPVGVEVAGEILTDLPGKRVTVVTSAQQLIAGKSPKIGAAAKAFIEKKGGQVILGQKAHEQANGGYSLVDGTLLTADVVYKTVGGVPNTAFLRPLGVLDAKGAIKVNDKLQVTGLNNVFAIGDATDIKELKLGFYAGLHGQLVARNVIAAASGKPLKAWKAGGPFSAMFVSLGRNSAAGHIGPVNLSGCLSFLPIKIKAKDLLTGMTKKELGIK